MDTATKRTFFTRLSTLIIAKAIFVFAGMAIILNQPATDHEAEHILNRLSSQVRAIGEQISRLERTDLQAGGTNLLSPVDPEPSAAELRAVRIFIRDENGQVTPLLTQRREGESAERALSWLDEPELVSQPQLQAMLSLPDGFTVPAAVHGKEALFIRKTSLADGQPSLLLAVANHDLFISNRSSLLTIVLVLFLASGTVSVLLVSLIRRRFQGPLQRLVEGMEKTARGEPFELSDNLEDKELAALARAFNSMSDQLLKQRHDLIAYNERLRESNEQLLESRLFLAALLDSTPLCVIATASDGRIMLCNRAAGETFGCDAEQAIGRSIGTFIPAPGQLDPSPDHTPRQAQAFEARCRRESGESFPAYVISATARDNSGRVVANIYIIRDITESRSFQEMMIRLDRYYTRGEMAGDIAHEINNYLAILSGNIELMPMILKKGDMEKIDRKLGVMKETADKIARFTDGLMDGPHEEARFEPTDLNQLVANVLAFLKPQNKFDYVDITTDLSGDMPLVEIDNGQVQQLLVNFLYNAAEALDGIEGEKQVVIRTTRTSEGASGRAVIEVIDNGPGVAEDKQAMLFRKRFTTKSRGHGIGLITCQRIAETHGGQVAYDRSDVTTFSCRIPIHHADSPDAAAVAPHDVADPALPVGSF